MKSLFSAESKALKYIISSDLNLIFPLLFPILILNQSLNMNHKKSIHLSLHLFHIKNHSYILSNRHFNLSYISYDHLNFLYHYCFLSILNLLDYCIHLKNLDYLEMEPVLRRFPIGLVDSSLLLHLGIQYLSTLDLFSSLSKISQ